MRIKIKKTEDAPESKEVLAEAITRISAALIKLECWYCRKGK